MGGSGSSCPPATGARFPPPGPEGRVRGARSSRCSGLGKLRHGAGRGRLCRSRSQTPHPWGPRCHCRPRLPPPAPRPHSPGTRGSGRTRRPQPLAAGLSWAALPGGAGWEAQSGPAEPREGAAPLAKCFGKRSSCPRGFSSSGGGGLVPQLHGHGPIQHRGRRPGLGTGRLGGRKGAGPHGGHSDITQQGHGAGDPRCPRPTPRVRAGSCAPRLGTGRVPRGPPLPQAPGSRDTVPGTAGELWWCHIPVTCPHAAAAAGTQGAPGAGGSAALPAAPQRAQRVSGGDRDTGFVAVRIRQDQGTKATVLGFWAGFSVGVF